MATSSPDVHTALSSLSIVGPLSCPKCSSGNTTTDHKLCEACQQQILQSLVDHFVADQPVSVWQCPRCTLCNKNNDDRCRACGTSKLVLVSS